MATFLFGNISQKRASYQIEPVPAALPTVVQGDNFTVAVRLTETADGNTTVTRPLISYARLSYGPIDVAPSAGTFRMVVGGVTSGVVTYGSTAASVAAVLNAMATPATAWSVTLDRDSYLVSRTDAWTATSGITIVENKLEPESFVRVTSYAAAGQFIQELRPMQSPLAYTSAFALLVPPGPTITRVVTGYGDAALGVEVNEVQRLYVPPQFDGIYQIYKGTARTPRLDREDGAVEIQAALIAGCTTANSGESFSVSNPKTYTADIEFTGALGGAPQDLLSVVVPESLQGDITFDLDLNTQGLLAALRENFEVTHPLTCEVGINYGTIATPNVKFVTVFQQNLTVQADGAWTGLAAAQRINWLNPPQPVNYIPFTTDQVITGIQSYTAVVTGAGPWTIAHNLGTEAIHVTVRENVSNGKILALADNASLGYYQVQTATSQSIVVTDMNGAGTPTAGWAVMISSAGPTSAFLAHTHTVAQVVSLQDLLNSLDGRVDALEASAIPYTLSASSTTTQPYEIPVASRQAVLFSGGQGTWAAQNNILQIATIPSVQAPQFLPALSVTAATAASAAIPTATTVDIVRAYTSGLNIQIPRIGLIPGVRLPSGLAHIGAESARSLVYEVANYDGGKTWYPRPYEVELFQIPLNDKLFKAGTKAKIQWNLHLQSRAANAVAQWLCIVDCGTVTTVSTPTTQGANLSNITWNTTPILAQPLWVTGEPVRHSLGAEVLAQTTTIFNANAFAYGVWSPVTASAPSSRNFILRARLANFDVTDQQGDPRGWVGYALRPYGDASEIKVIVE